MAKKTILKSLKVKKVGAPNKNREEKKDPNTGFTLAQKDWIEKEALGRNVDKTEIHREAMAMYIVAIESQREEVPLPVDDIVELKK